MKKILITLAICVLPATAPAERVYTWTDERGVTHYSDMPKDERAEELSPSRMNLYQRFAPQPVVDDPPEAPENDLDEPEFPGYEALTIASPGDEATVRDNLGNVEVEVQLEPELQEDHRLVALLNGERRGEFDSLQFVIPEVHRGTWELQVAVEDADGQVLIESATATFYMHQASARFRD